MYIVRFITKSGMNKDFHYNNAQEALSCMKSFANDKSGRYARIELIYIEDCEIIVTALIFE